MSMPVDGEHVVFVIRDQERLAFLPLTRPLAQGAAESATRGLIRWAAESATRGQILGAESATPG